jgi:hypothetical protein
LRLFPEQPKNQREYHTDQQAGDDGELEAEVVAFVMDIAGHAANPAATEAGPKDRPDSRNEEAGDDEKFAKVRHVFS